jgi:hypothetical protein
VSTRRAFLGQTIGAAALLSLRPQAVLAEWPEPGNGGAVDEGMRALAGRALGYKPPVARLVKLARTGDTEDYVVLLQGRSGQWAKKRLRVSGAFITIYGVDSSYYRAEVAYQVAKHTRECARDLAHLEGIDYRRNEARA